jgi:hypothetical protein
MSARGRQAAPALQIKEVLQGKGSAAGAGDAAGSSRGPPSHVSGLCIHAVLLGLGEACTAGPAWGCDTCLLCLPAQSQVNLDMRIQRKIAVPGHF